MKAPLIKIVVLMKVQELCLWKKTGRHIGMGEKVTFLLNVLPDTCANNLPMVFKIAEWIVLSPCFFFAVGIVVLVLWHQIEKKVTTHIVQVCGVLVYLVCFRKTEANKTGGLASLSDAPPQKSGLSSLTGAPLLKESDSKFSHVSVFWWM